jgi:Rap1a immunity proteins
MLRSHQFQFVRGVILIVTLMLLFPWGEAKAQGIGGTLGSMMNLCLKLESYWQQHPPNWTSGATVPNDPGAAICYGYILGFSDASGLVDSPSDCSKGFGPNCRPVSHLCIPAGVLFDQALGVFLAYARSHTANWHERLTGHYYAAMIAAFPCKASTQ